MNNKNFEKKLETLASEQKPICPSAGVDCENCPAYEPCEVEAAKLQQAYDKGFEDCRQAVLDLINANWKYEGLEVPVNSLLPVTQKSETITEFADRCRECGAKYGKLLKQKSGEWIDVTNGRGGHKCSLCGEYAPSYQNGEEWLTKFCPSCGKKMVDPQESEE